jgi:hypothetical protein
VCLIVATRSRGPPGSQPVIKEMSASGASGTPYIFRTMIIALSAVCVQCSIWLVSLIP